MYRGIELNKRVADVSIVLATFGIGMDLVLVQMMHVDLGFIPGILGVDSVRGDPGPARSSCKL